MGGAAGPEPMGGASDVPAGDPMGGGAPMGGDPSMGGDPMSDPMGGDPGMGGGPMDGGAPVGDPGMGGPDQGGMNDGQLNPDMGGEPPMDGPDGGAEGGDDSTMSLFNQLSDEDKEAARGYIESMLNRDESQSGDDMGDEPPMGGPDGGPDGGPMMENYRRYGRIYENLPVTDLYNKKEKNTNEKKKGTGVSKKSPFNSPRFK